MPQNQSIYTQVLNPIDFVSLRSQLLDYKLKIENELKKSKSLIYFELESHKYYYPMVAMTEKVEVDREVFQCQKNPLEYNPFSNSYHDESSGLDYFAVNSLSEFNNVRGTAQAREHIR